MFMVLITDFFKSFCRTTNYCLNVAAEQDKTVTEKWLPELTNAVVNAQKCLEDCKYVRGLVSNFDMIILLLVPVLI